MTALQVFYEGKVQGVGFRFTAKSIARGFDISGWVANLPDGRVELQVAGECEEVEAFLQAIQESVLAGHIANETRHPLSPETRFRGFEIRA